MFGEKVEAAARAHALVEFPKESVGAVADGEYRPLENSADSPKDSFRVVCYPESSVAIIHSHTQTASVAPSADDMRSQQAHGKPWGIISCNGRKASAIDWFGDQSTMHKFVGREFRSGSRDCWCLIRDLYKVGLGINSLPNLPRDSDWYEGHHPQDLLSNLEIEKAGFYRIDMAELRPWDIMLGSIGSRVTNHCAIYIGGDMILHHTEQAPSCRVILNPWKKRIRYFLRHKDLTDLSLNELADIKEVLRNENPVPPRNAR